MNFFSYIVSNTKRYDFRAFILISFLLQFVLLLAAPFRKKTSNRELLCVVWLAYLVSDWASNFAVGLIPPAESDILMLWAPFTLLHIGGVDSIPALSSTDNDLWSRLAIQLATMIYGISNAFRRSFAGSNLKVLVMLMFVAGLSSFTERILCLSEARFSSLKESLLEQRQKTESSKKSLDFDGDEDETSHSHELSDAKLLKHAYCLFKSFKPLFVDLHVDSDDRSKSREYMRRRSPAEAFRVVEIELNLAYDLFYTKLPVIRHGLDWTLASVARKSSTIGTKLVDVWLSLRKRRWEKYSSSKEAPVSVLLSRVVFLRWSESIPRLNLIIDVCLLSDYHSEKRDKMDEMFGLDFARNKLKRVPKEWFTNDLRDLLFRELKDISTRGQWNLENYNPRIEEVARLINTWITEKTFDESLILWHIATAICYHTEDDQEDRPENQCREFSLLLSDYMLYLLLHRPEMMLEVAAMGDMRYGATRAKVKSFIRQYYGREINNEDDEVRLVRLVCEELLTEVSDEGEDSSSVLYGACVLAKEIKELKERRVIEMWEVIFKVWVEMLCYGAARCSPSAHAAELANGGELLTLVWLLMEHLGSGK